MADDLERLTLNYRTAVLRVRQMPVPAIDKVIVLVDLEGDLQAGAGRPAGSRLP